MSLFCPRCGGSTGPKDRFCKGCGGNLQTLRQKMGAGAAVGLSAPRAPAAVRPSPVAPRGPMPAMATAGARTAGRPTAPAPSAPAPKAAAPARPSVPATPKPTPAPAKSAAPAKAAAPPAPARPAGSRIVIPDIADVPLAEDDDLFAGMVKKPDEQAAAEPPPNAFEVPDSSMEDDMPDLPPLRPTAAMPAVAPAKPAPAKTAPAPPGLAAPAAKSPPAPPRPAPAARPAPPPPPPEPEPEPAPQGEADVSLAPSAVKPSDSFNFYDIDTSVAGNLEEVDFSSLSSPAMAANEGASFYDLDALSSSGAPVPPAEGGEAVYDLDSFFSGSGPVAVPGKAAAPKPAAPAKAAPKQELVDFSALSSSEPSAYDLDSLSLLGGTDPFASLLVPSQKGAAAPVIGQKDIAEMENELSRAAGPGAGRPAAGSPCLVVYQNNRAVNYYALGQEETFLGKDEAGENMFPGLDLSRYDPSGAISALHASILAEGNKYFILDIKESTGTKVNGNLIPKGQKVPLKDGDALLLGGKVLIRFEIMKG